MKRLFALLAMTASTLLAAAQPHTPESTVTGGAVDVSCGRAVIAVRREPSGRVLRVTVEITGWFSRTKALQSVEVGTDKFDDLVSAVNHVTTRANRNFAGSDDSAIRDSVAVWTSWASQNLTLDQVVSGIQKIATGVTPLHPKAVPPISETLPGAVVMFWGTSKHDVRISAKGNWWSVRDDGTDFWAGSVEYPAPDRAIMIGRRWYESGDLSHEVRFPIRFPTQDPANGLAVNGNEEIKVRFLHKLPEN